MATGENGAALAVEPEEWLEQPSLYGFYPGGPQIFAVACPGVLRRRAGAQYFEQLMVVPAVGLNEESCASMLTNISSSLSQPRGNSKLK